MRRKQVERGRPVVPLAFVRKICKAHTVKENLGEKKREFAMFAPRAIAAKRTRHSFLAFRNTGLSHKERHHTRHHRVIVVK